jgi:hypothetical protein
LSSIHYMRSAPEVCIFFYGLCERSVAVCLNLVK